LGSPARQAIVPNLSRSPHERHHPDHLMQQVSTWLAPKSPAIDRVRLLDNTYFVTALLLPSIVVVLAIRSSGQPRGHRKINSRPSRLRVSLQRIILLFPADFSPFWWALPAYITDLPATA
jgi:hypothetical protein